VEGGDDTHAKLLTATQSTRNDSFQGPRGRSHLYLFDAQLKNGKFSTSL